MRNDEFIDFLESEQGLSSGTARCYERMVRRMWPNDPTGWASRYLRGKPQGTATVVKSAARQWIRFQGKDPSKYVFKGGRGRTHSRAAQALTDGQLRAYYKAASNVDDPVRTILMLLPRTGMRISEICAAKKSNVDKRKGRFALVFTGKRDKERRVYLSRPAEKILDTYLKQNQTKSDYLFPGRKKSHITPSRVRQVASEIGQQVGFRVNPHTLRHTYASTLHEQGVTLPVLKEAMGHESERTTMRYIHPSDKELIEAADAAEKGR